MTKLQDRREALGLSQEDLAEEAEMLIGTIQEYEDRTRDINSADCWTLVKLCRALECSSCDLMEAEVNT